MACICVMICCGSVGMNLAVWFGIWNLQTVRIHGIHLCLNLLWQCGHKFGSVVWHGKLILVCLYVCMFLNNPEPIRTSPLTLSKQIPFVVVQQCFSSFLQESMNSPLAALMEDQLPGSLAPTLPYLEDAWGRRWSSSGTPHTTSNGGPQHATALTTADSRHEHTRLCSS